MHAGACLHGGCAFVCMSTVAYVYVSHHTRRLCVLSADRTICPRSCGVVCHGG